MSATSAAGPGKPVLVWLLVTVAVLCVGAVAIMVWRSNSEQEASSGGPVRQMKASVRGRHRSSASDMNH